MIEGNRITLSHTATPRFIGRFSGLLKECDQLVTKTFFADLPYRDAPLLIHRAPLIFDVSTQAFLYMILWA